MIPALSVSLLLAEEQPVAGTESVAAPVSGEEGGKAKQPGSKQKGREEKERKEERPGAGHHGRRGLFWKDMNDSQRERLLYYHHLIIKKYDLNKSRVLEPEEMEVLKKDSRRFREERRQAVLKKFDKDGDGKLGEEERAAMRDELRIHIEKRMKERRQGKAADDEDMPPPPPPERRGREGRSGESGPGIGEGRGKGGHEYGIKGQEGRRGQERGRAWGPEGMIMSLGYQLMMEKFDKDKDGKLSEEERKAYNEDRKRFNRWLTVMRKKLKEEGRLEEVEKNPPPIIMSPRPPSGEGKKEKASGGEKKGDVAENEEKK